MNAGLQRQLAPTGVAVQLNTRMQTDEDRLHQIRFDGRKAFDDLIRSDFVYNRCMAHMVSSEVQPRGFQALHPVALFSLCAHGEERSAAWTEFLRRYETRIRYFIRGTLRQAGADKRGALGGVQEGDLFQNTVLRLVENDYAAIKRFSGTREDELLAYLAVISRSVVRDHLRRHRAFKRRGETEELSGPVGSRTALDGAVEHPTLERQLLARELMSLSQDTITRRSGDSSSRDRLVFQLHFLHDLSFAQIAECKGINLSKAGVEKLVNRLVNRIRTLASTTAPEATLP
jgi:RNA polymerase sigma factor (sigma-70 family)